MSALAEDVHGKRREAARRAAARVPGRRPGGRRRPTGPAVGGDPRRRAGWRLCEPVRRPRRSPHRRSPRARRRARAAVRAARPAVRQDSAGTLGRGGRRAAHRAERAPWQARLRGRARDDPSGLGRHGESRGADRRGGCTSTPSCSESCGRDERVRDRALRRAGVDPRRRRPRLAPDPAPVRGRARSGSTRTRPRRSAGTSSSATPSSCSATRRCTSSSAAVRASC